LAVLKEAGGFQRKGGLKNGQDKKNHNYFDIGSGLLLCSRFVGRGRNQKVG
jgi:hypothetical protein